MRDISPDTISASECARLSPSERATRFTPSQYWPAGLTLAALSFPVLAASAGEQVDVVRAVSPDSTLLVRGARGEFQIRGWARDEVQVSGELDDLATGLTFETHGQKVLLRVDMPERGVNWGDGSDLQIQVPRAMRLRVDTISADVELTDLNGDTGVRTVSGDVEGERLGTSTHIKTTSGDVELSGASGIVRVITTSGSTQLDVTAREVQVDTMSGDVDLELAGFDAVRANTVSGELTIAGSMNRGGSLEGSTVSGDALVRLAGRIDTQVNCRTGPAGDIDNGLNAARPEEGPGSTVLQATVGDGNGHVRLTTVAGTIRLKQR